MADQPREDGRMDPIIKARWVAALRSGRYKQGKGVLHNVLNGTFCCLGVLCDVVAAPVDTSGIEALYGELGERSSMVLPPSVKRAASLYDSNPTIKYNRYMRPLAGMNDDGVPFSEIADLIEAQL